MRNFFKEIPIEMKELAIIDGTDDVTTLIKLLTFIKACDCYNEPVLFSRL